MRDLLADHARLAAAGAVGRAVVLATWGSAPRLPGAVLLATPGGEMAGSVSGGCVEGAVIEAIGAAIVEGHSRRMDFVVSDETAWLSGLACGGSLAVLVEPAVPAEVIAAASAEETRVVITALGGSLATGSRLVWCEGGDLSGAAGLPPGLADALADQAARAADRLASGVGTVTSGEHRVEAFFEVLARRPTLFCIGAVHITEVLIRLARPLGFRTVVADGRAAFASRDRFPEADLVLVAWPDEAFARVGIDRGTCVCVLSHDPKFDEPALELALRSPAAYVGAIGSRQMQEARRARLAAAGIPPEDLARLHGPIGLDLGGRAPAEIALAILAEICAVRYGRRFGRGRAGA
jgi:xanthine dehydrogenase accessory factor